MPPGTAYAVDAGSGVVVSGDGHRVRSHKNSYILSVGSLVVAMVSQNLAVCLSPLWLTGLERRPQLLDIRA